ncbi:response regulator [Acidobacteria bacterium AB60]|nr:response regulator [Acidobacteria bacterium AB60]
MEGSLNLTSVFPGSSEMARRMRELDWSLTDFGSPEYWPENLKVAVSMCLSSRFPVLLWWGPKLNVLYNDAYLPWLGREKHPRGLARPGIESWPEIWNTIGPMLQGVRATGTATWSEGKELYFNRKLLKEEVYITWTYAPIFAADGSTVDGIFSPCTEITEQVIGARRLETLRKIGIHSPEHRSSEAACQQAAAVLTENPRDISFAAIYLVNASGSEARLTASVSPAGKDIFPQQLSASEANSSSPWSLGRVLRSRCAEEIEDLAERGTQISCELWPEPVKNAIAIPIFDGPETPVGLLLAGAGARRPWDAAYRAFFELIAGHIGSAISETKAYEHERKRAESLAELDRAKTAFFNNISHEFRTPLTLMLGPTEAALNSSECALRGRELEMVHHNQLRLLKLVNALLDFSRIEEGRMQASFQPTDIALFTGELASAFRSAMERAGLEYVVDYPAIDQSILLDRDMWEKIVLNLISNAFKYTFEGKVSVSIRSVDGRVELQVRDTGTGIPEHELPNIFKRFHRVANAKGRSIEGTGIGLALVQELVKIHGGTVRVESTDGKGSCFTVSIPHVNPNVRTEGTSAPRMLVSNIIRADSFVEEALRWLPSGSNASGKEELPIQPDPATSSFSALVSDSRSDELIAIADDNADMRQYLYRLLSPRYRVLVFSNGADALAAAREYGADLIIADVMMPVLDGFGLLKAVRADPVLRLKPLILLSARAGEEARVEGMEAGADDYLVKPFTARELLARAGAHLKLARFRMEAAEAERRLRAEVENERNRLRDSFSQGPAPVAILDGFEYRFTFVNDAFVSLFGRPFKLLQGRTFRESFPEMEGQGYFEPLDAVYETGLAYGSREMRLVLNRSGVEVTIYLDFTYLPMCNAAGDLEGILFQCADVTDKQVTRSKLEQRVNERTADLEQARDNLRTLNQDLLIAQEEERRRLSLELHDGAGQWIVALRWKLSSLAGLLGGESQPMVRGLNEALELLDCLTQELRTVSYLLHPPLLEDSGLVAALRQYTDGLYERNGLAVNLQIDANLRRMPRDIEATVFRIVQESLTNVHKHAKTKSATVRIWYESESIEVVIGDSGIGIPGFSSLDSPNVRFGVGIQGMRERARYLNGTFNIQSTTSGTVVSATLPCTMG